MNNIRLYLVDVDGSTTIPSKMMVPSTGIPRKGDTLNLFEVIPEEDQSDNGWMYLVEDVEWSMEGYEMLEPVVHISLKK